MYNDPTISKDEWLNFCRTGAYGREENEETVHARADSEQFSVTDERDSTSLFQSRFQNAYQGEDIRGYLISIPG
jgi:hypothetical protein